MQWQLFTYTKLNLEGKLPKVISDHTGILSSKVFLSFLDEKAVNYLVTDKVPEMISVSGTIPAMVILTNLKNVPSFITNKFTHRHFTHDDIPLNGDIASILKNLNSDTIIQLLNYVFASDVHQVINRSNIEKLLTFAQSHFIKSEINSSIEQLVSLLQSQPQVETVLQLGRIWGKLVYMSATNDDNRYESFIEQVDHFAASFVLSDGMQQASFASTQKNPKSVDKILANIKSDDPEKTALICFDCMGYAEWYLLQEYLSNNGLSFTDTALFTMLPSVTCISRSAIFRGSRDVFNIKSPGMSDEAKAFKEYFTGKETKYFTEKDLITDDSLLGYDCISILYNFFDDLCHSTKFPPNETGKQLYFDAVRAYLKKSLVSQTLQTLRSNGFIIYICSDHGSVVAFGNGKKFDKYLIDSFAKRAIIIPAEASLLIEYTKIKIPFIDDKLIALPEGRTMFANKNQIEINHGGITVEEMVVPFIKIKQ